MQGTVITHWQDAVAFYLTVGVDERADGIITEYTGQVPFADPPPADLDAQLLAAVEAERARSLALTAGASGPSTDPLPQLVGEIVELA